MIKSISIKNFQSHEKTILKFHEGINAIVGKSDSGKSAVLRALNWGVNNKPAGNAFKTNGKDSVKVEIETDKNLIVRKKTKKHENEYAITGTDIGDNVNSFKSFGQDVPKPVKNIFNINELNIQKQLDKPFLLGETPSEVAKILNKVANLNKIETVFKKINSKILTNSSTQKMAKTKIRELEEGLLKFADIEAQENKVGQAEIVHTKIETIDKNIITLSILLVDANSCQENLAKKPKIETAKILLHEIGMAEKKLKKSKKNIVALKELIDSGKEQKTLINEYNEKIKSKKKLVKIESVKNIMDKITSEQKILDTLIVNSKKIDERKIRVTGELEALKEKYKNLKPDVCPTCGQEWIDG